MENKNEEVEVLEIETVDEIEVSAQPPANSRCQ